MSSPHKTAADWGRTTRKKRLTPWSMQYSALPQSAPAALPPTFSPTRPLDHPPRWVPLGACWPSLGLSMDVNVCRWLCGERPRGAGLRSLCACPREGRRRCHKRGTSCRARAASAVLGEASLTVMASVPEESAASAFRRSGSRYFPYVRPSITNFL
jgi:hypothetical protein